MMKNKLISFLILIALIFGGILIPVLKSTEVEVSAVEDNTVIGQTVNLDDNSKKALKTLRNYEIDEQTSAGSDFFRWLGFTLVKWLGSVVDYLADGINKVYKLLSFSTSDGIGKLVNKYSALYKALFIVALVFLGIYMILGKKGNQMNTVNCILIIGVVIMGMPLFTQKISDMTISASSYAQSQWTEGGTFDSVAGQKIKENIVDLKKVDNNGINNVKKGQPYNDINTSNDSSTAKSWRTMDINAIMDWDGGSLKNDYWGHELDDGDEVVSQEKGFMGIGKSYYYRYQVTSWFNIIMSLLIMIAVFFFAIIKCARLIIEVAMAEIYIPFIAITDIASGQRIKEAIKHFITLFFAIFMCIALLGVYFVGNTFISNLDYPAFLKIVLQIALAWAIIDGPNILERILGVDVGLSSGWQFVMGAKAAGDMAQAGSRSVAGAANMSRKATGAAKRGFGAVAGQKAPKEKDIPHDGKRHGGVAGMMRGEKFDGSQRNKAGEAANAMPQAQAGSRTEPSQRPPSGSAGATVRPSPKSSAGRSSAGDRRRPVIPPAKNNGSERK